MREFTGFVRWFNSAKGYGFLGRDGHSDVFVHFTSIKANGYRSLTEGEAVTFDVIMGQQGLQADNVERIDATKIKPEVPVGAMREEKRADTRAA